MWAWWVAAVVLPAVTAALHPLRCPGAAEVRARGRQGRICVRRIPDSQNFPAQPLYHLRVTRLHHEVGGGHDAGEYIVRELTAVTLWERGGEVSNR